MVTVTLPSRFSKPNSAARASGDLAERAQRLERREGSTSLVAGVVDAKIVGGGLAAAGGRRRRRPAGGGVFVLDRAEKPALALLLFARLEIDLLGLRLVDDALDVGGACRSTP